jgi:hypothetical protein
MNKTLLAFGFVAAFALGEACDNQDDTSHAAASLPSATLSMTTSADIDHLETSQSVPFTIEARNLVLVDPSDAPPPAHEADAVFLELHLDDESTAALLVTARTIVAVTIPADTQAGPHRIICRAHMHDDGSPTDAVFTLDITVSTNMPANGAVPSTAVF